MRVEEMKVITIRKSQDRGAAKMGWLDSRHTFSFGSYHDPKHMHWGPLRVINEDFIAPGAGFPTHPHRDMEIVTWVLSGALAHKDSTGTEAVIRPGELQRMTAGTGIRHSEYNASGSEQVHMLQIWMMPARDGLAPGYEQKMVAPSIDGKIGLVGSQDGREGSITINQDIDLYAARLAVGQTIEVPVQESRLQWVQVARGDVFLNGVALLQGDGAAIANENALTLTAESAAEILVFDMAA
jgi:redox-sensitive bicupin YhaK (pirin superfamily)